MLNNSLLYRYLKYVLSDSFGLLVSFWSHFQERLFTLTRMAAHSSPIQLIP
jgi:hypothetical protein